MSLELHVIDRHLLESLCTLGLQGGIHDHQVQSEDVVQFGSIEGSVRRYVLEASSSIEEPEI